MNRDEIAALKPYFASALRPRTPFLITPFPGVYAPYKRKGSASTFPGHNAIAVAYAEVTLLRRARSSGRVDWHDLEGALWEHVYSGKQETILHGDPPDVVLALFDHDNLRVDEYIIRGCVKDGERIEVLYDRIPYIGSLHAYTRPILTVEEAQANRVRRRSVRGLTENDPDLGCGPQWAWEG